MTDKDPADVLAEKIYRIFSEHQTIDSVCIQDIAAEIRAYGEEIEQACLKVRSCDYCQYEGFALAREMAAKKAAMTVSEDGQEHFDFTIEKAIRALKMPEDK